MWDKLVCIQLYHTVNKRMYINQSCHCNGSTMQVLLGCLSTTIHKMPLKSYGVEMLAHGSETAHPLLVNPSLLTHHKWHCCTMAIAIQLLEDTSKFSPTGRNLQCNKINVQYYYNKPSSSMYHKSAHFKPFLQWAYLTLDECQSISLTTSCTWCKMITCQDNRCSAMSNMHNITALQHQSTNTHKDNSPT